jgi:hypothetical protein
VLRVLFLLATLPVLVACMGDSGATYERGGLERMVVQSDDLGKVWIRFDAGRQVSADQPTGERSDPSRFGRVDGWKARYRRPGSPQTRGPLVIESRADVFEDEDGAREDFQAYRDELAASGTRVEDEPGLGDEALVSTLVQGDVRFYLVLWRDSNAVASINVNGFERRLTRREAVALARKQQRRIEEMAAE